MFKKTTTLLVLLAILALGLAACSGEEAESNVADTGGPPAAVDGQQAGPGEQQMPDLAAAAEQLGVTEEALATALGDPGQGVPDFAAAAAELGITEADLMAALGIAEGGMPPGGQPPAGRP